MKKEVSTDHDIDELIKQSKVFKDLFDNVNRLMDSIKKYDNSNQVNALTVQGALIEEAINNLSKPLNSNVQIINSLAESINSNSRSLDKIADAINKFACTQDLLDDRVMARRIILERANSGVLSGDIKNVPGLIHGLFPELKRFDF